MGRHGTQGGFVAVEWVAAVGLLLLPVVLLVGSLPTWSERRHAAVVAAREAARVTAQGYPSDVATEAAALAASIAETYGVGAGEIRVTVLADLRRGGTVTATATVEMPAMVVPGVGYAGAWEWTVAQSVRIDDYRSG